MNVPEYNSVQMLQATGAMSGKKATAPMQSSSVFPETFGSAMGRASKKQLTKEEQAYNAAGDLVSNALILPVLEQLRRGSLAKDSVFSPGIAENTFGPEFDIQIADRIAHSPNMACTKAIAERLLNKGKPASRVKGNSRAVAEDSVSKVEIYG